MIKNTPYTDFEKTAGYICNLCGFPAVQPEKMRVMVSFLQDTHGHNTLQDLENAFIALAAGRLDEKLESIKSLTGLTAARVLQAYQRSQNSKADNVPQPDKDRSFLGDENRDIIYQKFSRWVKYKDELSEEESKYLMGYWVEQSRKSYLQGGKTELLTTGSFDYFERNGTIRNNDGMFQHFDGATYQDICPWDEIEAGGKMLKSNNELALQRAKQEKGIKQMNLSPTNVSLQDSIKKFAVSVYFDQLI